MKERHEQVKKDDRKERDNMEKRATKLRIIRR